MKPKYIVIVVLCMVAGFAIWFNYERGSYITVDKNIPQTISSSADNYVISKVGQDFFSKYVINKSGEYYEGMDCNNCGNYLHQPHYVMAYALKMPNEPKIQGLIDFAVDINGNVIEEREAYGIPNCIQQPAECAFISKGQAIKIAENANFKKGIEEWEVNFSWTGKEKTYLWGITNTLYDDSAKDIRGGEVMAIDANSGDIIDTNSWTSIP